MRKLKQTLTKSIVKDCHELFMEPGYQEESSAHQLEDDEEKFLRLLKSD